VTDARQIGRAGLIVSAAFLAARLLGYVRTVVIVNAFHVPDPSLDAFYAAFRIPDFIFQLVAAGALSSALIPIIASLLATDQQQRAWRVASTVADLLLAALLVLGLIVLIAAPAIVRAFTPGFTDDQLETTVRLTRIMLLSPIFLSMGALATSLLNAGGRFTAAALAPVTYNLAIIGAVLVLRPTLGVDGVALGVAAGSLCHLLVQLRPLARMGFRYQPILDLGDEQARKALALMAPRAVGLGASQITFVVVTSLASSLGPGAITSFNVAFTLLQIPIGVIGVPLGVVVFPALSREAAVGRAEDFASLLTKALRLLLYVMIPIGVLAAILRVQTVQVLFGFTGHYSAASMTQTADTFLAFLVGLSAHALIAVLARAFYARQDTITPVLAAVLAVVINSTLAAILVGPLGLPGVGLAIAVAAWVEALLLFVVIARRLGQVDAGAVVGLAAGSIVGTVVAGIAGFATLQLLGGWAGPQPGSLVSLVEVIVTSAVFAIVYALVSIALRIAELPTIVGLMVDVVRRPRRS
jgi:putative peptidoglycan lipid II flippase